MPSDNEKEVRAAIEILQFLGDMYGTIRGSARLQQLGTYTSAAAIEDRIRELVGDEHQEGEIAFFKRLRDNAQEYIERARELSPDVFAMPEEPTAEQDFVIPPDED